MESLFWNFGNHTSFQEVYVNEEAFFVEQEGILKQNGHLNVNSENVSRL